MVFLIISAKIKEIIESGKIFFKQISELGKRV